MPSLVLIRGRANGVGSPKAITPQRMEVSHKCIDRVSISGVPCKQEENHQFHDDHYQVIVFPVRLCLVRLNNKYQVREDDDRRTPAIYG